MVVFEQPLSTRQLLVFITLIILVVTIPLGVYLVKREQIIKSRAAEEVKLEFVDDSGNPITTTKSRNVKLESTYQHKTSSTSLTLSASIDHILISTILLSEITQVALAQSPSMLATASKASPSPSASTIPQLVCGFIGPTSLLVGKKGTFTSISTGPITSYLWNITGGSDSGTDPTFNWVPTKVGTWRVFLDIRGGDLFASCSQSVFVNSTSLGPLTSPTISPTIFPSHLRVANSQNELASASEQAFTPPSQIIDWELIEGIGLKTVYAQFKIGGIWGPVLSAQITLTEDTTYTPSPTSPSPLPLIVSPSPSKFATSSPSLSPPSPIISPTTNKFNLNKDLVINSADIAVLLNEWRKGASKESPQADFNADGIINTFDYALLRVNL